MVAACRKPGVSIAAVALANGLNANLLRRWVVAEERAQAGEADRAGDCVAGAVEPSRTRTFIPLQVEQLCGQYGAGDHDRVAARGDGGESRLAVGRGSRLRWPGCVSCCGDPH